MGHAKRSASESHRWLNCPGSIAMKAASPVRPSGYAAMEGTAAHKLLEHCGKTGDSPQVHLGAPIYVCLNPDCGEAQPLGEGDGPEDDQCFACGKDHFQRFVVDQDMIDAVVVCLEEVHAILAEAELAGGKVCVEYECKAPLDWVMPDTGGTTDVAIFGSALDRLYVIDYKHGRATRVEVPKNTQLMSYGAGVVHKILGSWPKDKPIPEHLQTLI